MKFDYISKREFYAITINDDGSLTHTLIGTVEYDPPRRGDTGRVIAFFTSDTAKVERIREALRAGRI
jgi:hypothetical protein